MASASATSTTGVPARAGVELSKGSHDRPLGPAALASALQNHPFPTANLGYTVTFEASVGPGRAGDPWTLDWQAPATEPEVSFDFSVYRNVAAADVVWDFFVRHAGDLGATVFDILPTPAWCSAGAKGYFVCQWIDASVQVDCSGGPPITKSRLCDGLFAASRRDLQEVDPHGGF
jgi:hypothetical protein